MTVFPGVEVSRIDTRDSVIEGNQSPEDRIRGVLETITPEQIREQLGDNERLVYTLRVSATNELAAKAKARAFVRAKNPFELGSVTFTSIDTIDDEGILKVYLIGVGVAKEGVLN